MNMLFLLFFVQYKSISTPLNELLKNGHLDRYLILIDASIKI